MLYIGIDLGTSSVKLLLMNEKGTIQKILSREYPLHFHRYGWSEQKPEDWFVQTIEGMKELIKYIKERYGVGVFVLSNISHYFADHSGEIDILNFSDGCVFSARVGITKPDHRIFDHMCKKFGLDPQETIFVDDSEKNINSAIAFGLQGYLFDGDSQKLRKHLDKVLN